jgi:outer membrane protein assembly factor BamB
MIATRFARLHRALVLGTTLTTAGFSSAGLQAEDWPTFRGANRTSVSSEKNLLDSWPADGPKLIWSGTGAGRGYASPAVSQGRIYTLGDGPSTANDQDEYLTCFSAQDGKQLWKTKTGPAWNDGSGNVHWQGSRSTPTVDGDRVYVLTPYGVLFCAQTSDGSVVWKRDLEKQFAGIKKDRWGYSESPLVDGQLLLCTPGGTQATVVALDKNSGEEVWRCVRPDDVGAGHSSIVISQVGGQKVYVQNTGGGPMGFSTDGTLLWDYDMKPPTAFIPSPVIKDSYVFAVAGYGLGGALLQQIPGANGSIAIKEIYGPKPELGNKHGGVILLGNKLYGGAEDKNIIYSADLLTGEVLWEKSRSSGTGSASVISADGKLYIRFQDGVVVLAKADADEYKEISSFTTPGSGSRDKPSWAHPVIANGKLLLREGDTILCYDISK